MQSLRPPVFFSARSETFADLLCLEAVAFLP